MKFSITNQGGQFLFWHTDCKEGEHKKLMSAPKLLPDNVKEFTCLACRKVGVVTLPHITAGIGWLETDLELEK